MFDSYVTVLGTVLNTPERRMTKNNAAVANFRIASHPRRYDRESHDWVDAPSLRIRVNCWRRLAEHVCGSVFSGDPVVVYGRIVTRDWVTEQGEQRVSYELEAISVGHDLARGTGVFTRSRPEPSGMVVEDPDLPPRTDADGGQSRTVASSGGSGVDGDASFDDFTFADGPSTVDALAILTAAGLESAPGEGEDEPVDDEEESTAGATDRARKRGRQPVGV